MKIPGSQAPLVIDGDIIPRSSDHTKLYPAFVPNGDVISCPFTSKKEKKSWLVTNINVNTKKQHE